jgi:hypothetical protein
MKKRKKRTPEEKRHGLPRLLEVTYRGSDYRFEVNAFYPASGSIHYDEPPSDAEVDIGDVFIAASTTKQTLFGKRYQRHYYARIPDDVAAELLSNDDAMYSAFCNAAQDAFYDLTYEPPF